MYNFGFYAINIHYVVFYLESIKYMFKFDFYLNAVYFNFLFHFAIK